MTTGVQNNRRTGIVKMRDEKTLSEIWNEARVRTHHCAQLGDRLSGTVGGATSESDCGPARLHPTDA
jgi:hypothetical protein